MSDYEKQKDWRNRQLAKGLCEKCPNPRAAGSARYCPYHLVRQRKLNRDGARRRNQGGMHIPMCPDCGYIDRPEKGIQHRQPQISQAEWINSPFYDKNIYGANYERAYDRFERPNDNFFGSSGQDPLELLLEKEEAGENVFG